MNAIVLSQHAKARMNQRGLRRSDVELILRCASEIIKSGLENVLEDVELILRCASEIGDDIFFLSRKDAEREIRRRKHEIQALERLRDQKVVVADDTIVTCYRSRCRDQKRMLRYSRECP